jgi:predicted ATP-grasp superfamily ATP-dependent carboligase
MAIPVLITDGNERAALAAARSLVAAGFEVHATSGTRRSLAGVSRGVWGHRCGADPLVDAGAYVEQVAALAARVGAAVLLPITDQSATAILERQDGVPAGTVVPLPPLGVFQAAADKQRVLALARDAGLEAPEAFVVHTVDEVDSVTESIFPAAVKPHRSLVPVRRGGRKLGVTLAGTRGEGVRAMRALPEEAYPVLVQRRVRGPGEGLFVLRWNGRVVAVFAHRRLREKPPGGGVSVYRESIIPPPALVDPGLRLLESLDWNGVAMVECKRNLETGGYAIMEINGRFWGSLQLAVDAGVDFPAMLVKCALGLEPAPIEGYRVGVRSRWFWGDMDHLYLRLRRSAVFLQLQEGYPSRWRAVADFLKHKPGRDRLEVLRWDDPAPFLLESARRLLPAGHLWQP